MRVLVTWGSKRGGTEGIGKTIGQALEARGFEVVMLPAAKVPRSEAFDAAIVGGALYANRWHRAARDFVRRHERRLRAVPVWFFSSGPLDHSTGGSGIPATRQVQALIDRLGVLGHATFGGRLEPGAKGFPASAMARKKAGDWRNFDDIRAWASGISEALPSAHPRPAIELPGQSLPRLLLHAFAGWGGCAVTMGALLEFVSLPVAFALHAVAAVAIYFLVAHHYFGVPGARDARSTAEAFAATTALLDLGLIGGLFQHSLAIARSLPGFWLPLALIFLVTWGVGEVMSMMPFPSAPPRTLHGA